MHDFTWNLWNNRNWEWTVFPNLELKWNVILWNAKNCFSSWIFRELKFTYSSLMYNLVMTKVLEETAFTLWESFLKTAFSAYKEEESVFCPSKCIFLNKVKTLYLQKSYNIVAILAFLLHKTLVKNPNHIHSIPTRMHVTF